MSLLRTWARRAVLAAAAVALSAQAGVMTRDALKARFPSPLMIGDKDTQLPVWPVFKQDATATVLVGYAFESIDLAPIPGFSGTPPNLLVLLDAKGSFVDVRVLSQHEPVFLDGLGEAPLLRFVEQYKGLSLRQGIKIGSGAQRGAEQSGTHATIDGVAKATASVRIVNQALLSSALRVARARLGFAAGRDPELLARVRRDTYAPMDWDALLRAGLVQRTRIDQRSVEQAFVGTGVEMPGASRDSFTEIHVAYLNSPAVGRNLLGESGWSHLLGRIDDGDHALLIIADGALSFVGADFVRGAVPDLLTLRQGGLPIELRDLDLDDPLKLPPALKRADAKVLRIIGPAGLDPALPLDLALRITRSKGIVYPERISRDFALRYQLPADQVERPESDEKSWHAIWRERARDLGILGAALALLALVLAWPRRLVADEVRLGRFRTGWQLFTLVFVGWIAQAQLSIVNVTAALQALQAGRDLGFLLHDPMSVVLWAFVALTLVVWGRGSFCGWLCPFGALQELASRLARHVGIHPRRLHRGVDAKLKKLKFAVLAAILCAAWLSPSLADRLVEFEPFKTAITLAFVRSWPYVLWAAALVIASAFVYKGFCRYLCPLGAALALLGRMRVFDWIPRRNECGTPCQTCRHRCEYQAIRLDGKVDYAECFQCLDCVAIHDSDRRCAPLIARRRERVIPIRPLPVAARSAADGR